MNNKQQLICYQQIHCKIQWKYSSTLKDDFEDIKVSDLQKEIGYCYGSTQYIMRFIEMLKHRVIRVLPELNNVKIILSLFDKNKLLHRLMVGTIHLINKMLNQENKIKNYYKIIFTTIKYKDEVVFMGIISFNGID